MKKIYYKIPKKNQIKIRINYKTHKENKIIIILQSPHKYFKNMI